VPSRKGKPNKFGAQARENIVAVFNRLGGTAEMAKWANDHKTDFYRMYAQLVPKEITADVVVTEEVTLTDAQLAAIATGSGDGIAQEASGEGEPPPVH
jgi:hypothetical protein